MSTTAVPSAAVQKQLKQGKVKKGIFSVIRHLVLALLAFIWLVPIAWLLLTSFSTDKGINFTRFVPEGFTLWNYISIMTAPDSVAQFPRWFMNTLVVACFNCVISTCFVLMVAYAISCCRFKGRRLLQNRWLRLLRRHHSPLQHNRLHQRLSQRRRRRSRTHCRALPPTR